MRTPEEAAVRAHLARVLKSPRFARSKKLKRFLTYVVEAKLGGEEDAIQEYARSVDNPAVCGADRAEDIRDLLDNIAVRNGLRP